MMAWTPFTRLEHDRSWQRYTSDMTDREFGLISAYLPDQPRLGRKRHIMTDTVGLLLKCDVHSAGIQDRDDAARLFDKLTTRRPSKKIENEIRKSQWGTASHWAEDSLVVPAGLSKVRF